MVNVRIPKRMSNALINSLTAGVVPRIGLEHITVGRKKEIDVLLNDLENIKEGGAFFRFISGSYGSGKSFLIQVIRNYSLDRGFVTSDVDLSPEKRLVGAKGQGQATYRELMQNIAIAARPDGGALESLLQKWIQNLHIEAMNEHGLSMDSPELKTEVRKKIFDIIGSMRGMNHGFDFSIALAGYWEGYKTENEDLKQAALRWLRGEFNTKTEAKAFLKVSEIINDENWYDYIKLFSKFISMVGYDGFVLFIDEGINLYKITNKIARDSNYEKLLSMFNDTMQGKASHLGILFGATPKLIKDERRGLYNYGALRSRIETAGFSGNNGYIDLSGPVMELKILSNEEIFLLLNKLSDVHSQHYNYEPAITDNDFIQFMQAISGRLGVDELLTPREVTRDFLRILNILYQNEEATFSGVLNSEEGAVKPAEKNPETEDDDLFAGFEL